MRLRTTTDFGRHESRRTTSVTGRRPATRHPPHRRRRDVHCRRPTDRRPRRRRPTIDSCRRRWSTPWWRCSRSASSTNPSTSPCAPVTRRSSSSSSPAESSPSPTCRATSRSTSPTSPMPMASRACSGSPSIRRDLAYVDYIDAGGHRRRGVRGRSDVWGVRPASPTRGAHRRPALRQPQRRAARLRPRRHAVHRPRRRWSGGDPGRDARSTSSTRLGKILRIDPHAAGDEPFTVPADNPFVGVAGADPTIWAFGLRNPWRFSFDRDTGDLWIADVGQGDIEEIDRAPATERRDAGKGLNFGWSAFEGLDRFNDDQSPDGVIAADLHVRPRRRPLLGQRRSRRPRFDHPRRSTVGTSSATTAPARSGPSTRPSPVDAPRVVPSPNSAGWRRSPRVPTGSCTPSQPAAPSAASSPPDRQAGRPLLSPITGDRADVTARGDACTPRRCRIAADRPIRVRDRCPSACRACRHPRPSGTQRGARRRRGRPETPPRPTRGR